MKWHEGVPGVLAAVVVGTVSMPAHAAITPEQISAHFRGAHPGCTVNTTVYGAGAIKGAPGPITLVNLAMESCGGSNMWSAELVGVYEQNGRLSVAKAPAALGIPEKAAIVEGRAVVSTVNYGPNDPRCCPSVHKTAGLVFSRGALVPGR